MQTSIEKSVLLMQEKWGNTQPEWCVLASILVQPPRIGVPIVCAHYCGCLLLQQSSDHARLLVRICNMSELSHIDEYSLSMINLL